jgi:mono/diheme cytochrome c family protein
MKKAFSLRVYLAGAAVCGGLFGAMLQHSAAQADSAGTVDNTPLPAVTSGKQIYEHICQGCHMPDAKGATGAGKYPALAGDPALASRQFMALTLLNGRRNMPAFSAKNAFGFGGAPASLTSAQIAAVINYVRTNFGNHFKDAIAPEEVTALDQGAPTH